jgi:hypothetical protein
VIEVDEIRKNLPNLLKNDTSEEEFDPNELKLFPVLATDRDTRRRGKNELRS